MNASKRVHSITVVFFLFFLALLVSGELVRAPDQPAAYCLKWMEADFFFCLARGVNVMCAAHCTLPSLVGWAKDSTSIHLGHGCLRLVEYSNQLPWTASVEE